jgi:c-di-GMP-binding flagellar brake protein YcgR
MTLYKKEPFYDKNEFVSYTWGMKNEKRKFFRHPIKVPIQLTLVENGPVLNARAEDLSQGGVAFFWPESIPEGTQLQLSLPVEKQLFKMRTRVTHSQKEASLSLFKIGVCFEDAVSSFRAKLAEEIIQIRQYREKMSLLRGNPFSEEEAARIWIGHNAEDFAKAMGSAS